MWLALCPCLSCGVTLQATCLAVPLLLQACDHSVVASNIQFGVQVPENCDVRLIAAWGKKKILTCLILEHTGMCPVKKVYSLKELNLCNAYLSMKE